jgi:DNA-binding winged helix-turn-helix (wHTH) protein/TolB-like protein
MPETQRTEAQQVVFDRFVFDRRSLELWRDGELVKIQQQPARVLAMLIDRAGELVTRDELRQSIWGEETFVDFSRGLNYCVNQIRSALSDTADSPRYVETLRGRGYRFIGQVRAAEEAAPAIEAALPAPQARPRFSRRRIALLALVTFVIALLAAWGIREWMRPPTAVGITAFALGAPGDRAWAEGLHAQLVSHLARASRAPVVDLKDSKARVAWKLEGRVDRSGEQYRVTVTLRRESDGSVRWADEFDGPPGDWIDAQNEMAVIITQAVRYYVEGPSAGGILRRVPRRPVH